MLKAGFWKRRVALLRLRLKRKAKLHKALVNKHREALLHYHRIYTLLGECRDFLGTFQAAREEPEVPQEEEGTTSEEHN
eukprot:6617910-Prorocentrum_lima.AAC.1